MQDMEHKIYQIWAMTLLQSTTTSLEIEQTTQAMMNDIVIIPNYYSESPPAKEQETSQMPPEHHRDLPTGTTPNESDETT